MLAILFMAVVLPLCVVFGYAIFDRLGALADEIAALEDRSLN